MGDTVAAQSLKPRATNGVGLTWGPLLAGFGVLLFIAFELWSLKPDTLKEGELGLPLLGFLAAWAGLIVGGLGVARTANWVVGLRSKNALVNFLPAALTGLLVVLFVEILIRAYRIPVALIPAPTQVLAALLASREVLLRDATQTFVFEVLLGFLIGSAAGTLAALLVSRFRFLELGFMPIAGVFASIPIVALAPILIKAVGIEWPSKMWVVAVTVFFPVLVNVARGLAEVNPLQVDLMRSYAANEVQSFSSLRVPNALPYLFTGLKIGSTLAMISAIVGEFFGATGSGLGFRIQIEVGRFAFDIVWSAIIVASVIGIGFYNLIAWLERRFTGWHVSLRTED